MAKYALTDKGIASLREYRKELNATIDHVKSDIVVMKMHLEACNDHLGDNEDAINEMITTILKKVETATTNIERLPGDMDGTVLKMEEWMIKSGNGMP